MTPARKFVVPAAYLALLAAIDFYLCRSLFIAEFTGHTNSLQGLWISMARLAGEHWFRPSWWPYQDGGMPFEHTYMPLVPASAALLAKLLHVSPARAFYSVMGLVICLGPMTLWLMIWRFTLAPGCAFWASLVYAITSPARALLPEPDFNLVRYWSSARFYGGVVWDDLPHQTAVCFLPLAILFLWRSLERRRTIYYMLAVLFMTLTVLPSVFGATSLFLSAVCMLAVLPRERLFENVRLLAILAGAAYLIVCPFLPPSEIAAIRSNQQRTVEDQWSAGSLVALAFVVGGCYALFRALHRWRSALYLRFWVLFAFVAASVPLIDAHLHFHFLPQPNRYSAEMEVGLALMVALIAGWASTRIPRSIRIALSVYILCVAAEQIAFLRQFSRDATRPADCNGRIEYRIARWVEANLPRQRAMVPGSIAQWFNVFTDTPQLSGASFSTSMNWTQQEAMTAILVSHTPEELASAVLWLKAFGVTSATVAGRHSPEFWKGISSTKFDGLLPVLWRQEDTTIYQVPQRSPSLAHAIPDSALAVRNADGVLPPGELQKYVTAIEDASLPLADMRWRSLRRFTIATAIAAGQAVSVQTGYHRGWHASANGRPAQVTRDGLGFLVVHPKCAGPCQIEMTYTGGWEYWLCRVLSALTILGVFGYGFREAKWR